MLSRDISRRERNRDYLSLLRGGVCPECGLHSILAMPDHWACASRECQSSWYALYEGSDNEWTKPQAYKD